MSFTRQQLEEWLSKIEVKTHRVYDVGGSQKSIKNRVKSWDVKKYKVLDLPKWDLNYDWGDVNYVDIIVRDQGNIVFCIEVSEYLFNPVQALENISRYLMKRGILYMSFHFVYPIHEPKGTDYLRYTPDGVRRLLKETGFEVVEMVDRVSRVDFKQIYKAEEMHTMDINNNIIGTLVKARKI